MSEEKNIPPSGNGSAKFQFQIIAGRELQKLFKLPNILIFLAAAVIVPLITALQLEDVNSYNVEVQALTLRDVLFFSTYFWLGGIVLAFFSTWIVSDFIAGEDSRGTLLSLITKPIRRWEVLLGKYIGYLIFIGVMELIAILIAIYVLVTASGAHLSVIWDLLLYVPILLFFTMFVALVFGTIPLVLSTLSKSRVLVIIPSTFLIILMYLGFFIIRSSFSEIYVDLHLYHFDPGYHLGNIFISLTEGVGINFTPSFQEQMGYFAGTHDLGGPVDEPDQGFQLASIPITNYYPKLVSWILWTVIPAGLTVLSVFKLKKKEIQ